MEGPKGLLEVVSEGGGGPNGRGGGDGRDGLDGGGGLFDGREGGRGEKIVSMKERKLGWIN